ncbi:hypothetical protein COU75_03525 [Candidatus Peregrinibacteria bacterium CG10_big_fil_rev_8_21_14_0_10_42_8]|nr:MAG: hypothetical protein COU75_03525 [Candidatus Peregrinibacteria bacterium CG10_big_fil_rev_8_21_14_0_10_42_8]
MQKYSESTGKMISIIIPIHNAFTYVHACIESLLHTTKNDHCTIVLIDDASTDPEIGMYLSAVQREYPHRVHLITLEQNVGFVQAVNYGFSQTRGQDVVLLNSDTIVYDGWIERLSTLATAHPDAGSITPLSNEASIYSVAQNDAIALKEKRLLENLAQNIALSKSTTLLTIPTAVGFCMYIPWKARAIVGVFNEIFGRGYGEENDWCMRARSAGFTHYLDESTFVFHEGGVSMSLSGDIPSREARSIPSHEELLQAMHSEYRNIVESFIRNDTRLDTIRHRVDAIAKNLLEEQSPCTVAHILHNSPRSIKVGGTEKHVEDLILSMSDTTHYLLYPSGSDHLAVSEFQNSELKDVESISIGTYITKAPQESLREFKEFLMSKRISVLHIHQLIGSNFSLIEAAKSCGISVVYSIHDYYAIGSPQLLQNGEFLGIPSGNTTCPSDPTKTYEQWQQDVYPLLEHVGTFVAPSQTARDTFAKIFPFVQDRCLIQEHGTEKIPPYAQVQQYHNNRICFLGYVHADHKGKALIASVLPLLIKEGVDIYFLGTLESEWPELAHNPHVHFFSKYTQEELPAILHCIAPRLVCLFPNWPETYSYTLSECFRMRIPVCVTNSGALAERIQKHGGGIILQNKDPQEIVHTIVHTITASMHDSLCREIDAMQLPDIQTVSDWYQNLYEKFPKPEPIAPVQKLPNFLIIGGQKCGSTWLWKNLSHHPDIYLPTQPECEFFSKNRAPSSRDIDNYSKTYFSQQKEEPVIGEKTASYFWTSTTHQEWYVGLQKPNPMTPKYVYDVLGKETKIVLSLRHPVMRALSAYCHHLHHGSLVHTGNFAETAKRHGIIHMGFYASHLQEWLRWFPKENIHVVILEEDIFQHPAETLHNVHTFLGTTHPDIIPEDLSTVFRGTTRTHINGIVYAHMNNNSATGKTILPITTEDELQKLYDIYLPGILELEQILQRPLQKTWSKKAFCKSTTAVHALQEGVTTPILTAPEPIVPRVSAPARKKAAYYVFSCLKDLWTDFGEPFPGAAVFIRHRILGKIWPVHSPNTREPLQKSYLPTHFFSHAEQEASRLAIRQMLFQPSLHLLLPVRHFDEIQLRQCLNALTQQTYIEWKVTVLDASKSGEILQNVIQEYSADFPHTFFYTSETRASIVRRSTEMYIGFLRIEDCLLPHTLATMMSAACEEAELPDAIYSDHDECLHRGAPQYSPIYKPDWSPELLLSFNYIRPFFIVQRETLLPFLLNDHLQSDAYTHDILLHLADGTHHVIHIPEILYHYYGDPLQEPSFENETKNVIEQCLKRRRISCTVIRPEESIKSHTLFFQIFYTPTKAQCSKVTIIIPTKDRIDLLHHCINTIRTKTDYPNYEIVIIDNNSTEPKTQAYLDSIPEQVIRIDTPAFNFAHINNEVVARTTGEFILLLNNDTEPADPHWLTTLVGTMLLDTRIGVVGSRLLYPPQHDIYRVQSIGMIIGRNWASLVQVDTKDALGYENYNYVLRNCSAIGGACLLTRRKLFSDIGGLDEHKFGVDFGDVDYCLRVQQEGYRVVCNPLSSVIHHESATRGNNGGLGANVKREEIIAFENKWGHMFGHDPYYNPHFSLSIHHNAFSTTVRR